RPFEPLPDDAEVLARLIGPAAESSDQLVQDQLIGNVRAAVASLPEHYRQVVVLCDLCEMTYADAAGRMGCAVGTVRSRLNRGHKFLAENGRSADVAAHIEHCSACRQWIEMEEQLSHHLHLLRDNAPAIPATLD